MVVSAMFGMSMVRNHYGFLDIAEKNELELIASSPWRPVKQISLIGERHSGTNWIFG